MVQAGMSSFWDDTGEQSLVRRSRVHKGAAQAGERALGLSRPVIWYAKAWRLWKKRGEVKRDCECSVLKSVVPWSSRRAVLPVAA